MTGSARPREGEGAARVRPRSGNIVDMAQRPIRKTGARRRPSDPEESPHDVLAAEEFGMGTPDPRLHVEPPHDVLAAEEFGMGTPDPVLHHHGPVALPGDPTGIQEPHDVLAAEEFAMPAPRGATSSPVGDAISAASERRPLLVAAGLAATVLLLRRRRR
jgi:hypothetical protein